MEAWQMYYDLLRARAERATTREFVDRETIVAEAAHAAYRETANRLASEHGWDEERALVETRGFNERVRGWIASGRYDWEELRTRLQG
jgi:hypothetical protein